MSISSAYSTKNTAEEIVSDLQKQLSGNDPRLLILFASPAIDQNALNTLAQSTFSNAHIFGCSTSGEITSGKMLKGSVVAMSLGADIIDDAIIGIMENIKEQPDVAGVFQTFENHFGVSMHDMDVNKYVGLILMDGLSGAEEQIMDSVGDRTNVSFIGGSAGDDLKFECTHVYANGKTYTNAAALILLKMKTPFDIIKTQSFCALKQKLTVTKVGGHGREVLEFDNKPATQAYADALQTSADQVPNFFMSNPVGLVISDDEVFVRSPQRVDGDGIMFYCSIPTGMEVSLLKSTNIIEDTRAALKEKQEQMGNISGVINFNCILRTLELEQEGNTEAFGEIFKDVPTVGFSTYGEAYIGHINQTATMLVIK